MEWLAESGSLRGLKVIERIWGIIARMGFQTEMSYDQIYVSVSSL